METEFAACKNCDLWRGATNQLLVGDGPEHASIMLVGEAPGDLEDRTGRPFVGESGKLLNRLLDMAGVQRADVRVTNAVRCRPPNNRKPTAKEINACKPLLAQEIAEVQPALIITLGNESMKSVTGLSGISKYRGQMQDCHHTIGVAADSKLKVMPTVHPAFALREPAHEAEIVQDFTTAVRSLRGGFAKIETHYWVWGAVQPGENSPHHPPLKYDSPVWSWDIETNAREMHDPELACRFLAVDDGTNIFIMDPWEAAPILNYYVNLPDRWLVGHNASRFDRMVFLEKYGVNLRTHDTQILAHLIAEEQPLKLQDLAIRYLGVAPWKDGFDKAFWERGPQTPEEWAAAYEYCARDTRYTRLLFLELWALADEREKHRYKALDLPASRAVAAMERNGAYVSLDNVKRAMAEIEVDARVALLELKAQTNPDFNPGSHQQVRALLFDDDAMGLPKQKKRTAAGEQSTDEETLMRLRSLNLGGTTLTSILAYREATKLLGTYLRPFSALADTSLFPPWIYPRYSTTTTVTGRTSSFTPNLQNVPRDPRVRSIIAAPPGYVLLEADASQLELRMAAELAGPDSLLFQEYLKPKPDVHLAMASRITGKPPELVTPEERTNAKPSNFAFLYTADWRTYQRLVLTDHGRSITEREARLAQDAFALWNVERTWWNPVRAELRERGQVTSIFGRTRRLPNIYSKDDYKRSEAEGQAINFTDQSPAGDVCLLFLTQLVGRGYFCTGYIHDSVHIMLPDDPGVIAEATAVIKHDFSVTIPALIENLFGYKWRVPLVADVSVGRWWGDGK
jgi:DNA polymerase-1